MAAPCPRPAWVVRRVGGLEGTGAAKERLEAVVRRVGGLEDTPGTVATSVLVVRRVGGLEVHFQFIAAFLKVVRRVGGLEGLIEESFIMRFPFLTRRRWNGRNGRSRNSPL